LVLAGIPPLVIFSGSYERLWMLHGLNAARITFWVIGLLTVFFTAVYLFRGVTTLFARNPESAVQPRFLAPAHLLSISVGALTLIGLLMLLWHWFVPFLGPALRRPVPTAAFELWQGGNFLPALAVPLLVALSGWAVRGCSM
jgi:NADH:ubiquinone oxidoreductase subunit 5 (subunit L)/multisubunit Na+/H+ antiporter MnhA subunit